MTPAYRPLVRSLLQPGPREPNRVAHSCGRNSSGAIEREHTTAMDSYRIAMDSYQLIAPSIKMFDSYPDSYHKDAFDSYHRDSLDSYHRDSLDSYPQGHHRDTLNYTKYA